MILISLVFVMSGIWLTEAQPVTCTEDMHCTAGFFCHTMTHSCHACLTCEHLNRQTLPKDIDCIKSGDQCGPCLQGLVKDEHHWSSMCLAPRIHVSSSYIYILITCITVWFLIILSIIQVIWKTQFIKVKLAIPEIDGSARTSIKEDLIKA